MKRDEESVIDGKSKDFETELLVQEETLAYNQIEY